MPRTALALSGLNVLVPEGPLTVAPGAVTLATAATGGTIAAGTYLAVVSVVTPLGETIGSAVSSIVTTGTTSTITIPSPTGIPLGPASPNFTAATGWYAYVTQVGGSTFTRQQAAGSPTPIGTSLVLTAPPTSTGVNPLLTNPAGVAFDQANGMVINMTTETVPPSFDAFRGILLRVNNTAASAFNFIVRAGLYPPAMRQFLGDLVVNIPASGTFLIGPLDMARHAVQDTTITPTGLEINLDAAAGFTGTITAFVIPRNVPGAP